jgi:hypothetical protein
MPSLRRCGLTFTAAGVVGRFRTRYDLVRTVRPNRLQRKGDMLRIQDLQTSGGQGRPNHVAAQLLQADAIGRLDARGRVQGKPS